MNGVFREVSGNGTISSDGEVSGTVTVAAASRPTESHGDELEPDQSHDVAGLEPAIKEIS